jgi:hypothetical protein
MADIKNKLSRGVGNNPRGELGTVPAFRAAVSPHNHRVTLDLDDASYRGLKLAAVREGTSMAALVRQMLQSLPELSEA